MSHEFRGSEEESSPLPLHDGVVVQVSLRGQHDGVLLSGDME